MLAEQLTSMSDNIEGEWETREVYVVGERTQPQRVARGGPPLGAWIRMG